MGEGGRRSGGGGEEWGRGGGEGIGERALGKYTCNRKKRTSIDKYRRGGEDERERERRGGREEEEGRRGGGEEGGEGGEVPKESTHGQQALQSS